MSHRETHTHDGDASVGRRTRERLTPADAEAVLARIRAEHGLGQHYAREVWLRGDGRWLIVAPNGDRTIVEPMPRVAFRRWLERVYFVEAIAERDMTTEG
jgi:hypothetical protein